jgi:hypothetical protein
MKQGERDMNSTRTLRRGITGLATATLLFAGGGLAAGTAQAQGPGPHHWCPGEPITYPTGPGPHYNWDWNVCHTYYWVNGKGNVPYDGKLPSDLYDGTNPPPLPDNPTCRVIGCAP